MKRNYLNIFNSSESHLPIPQSPPKLQPHLNPSFINQQFITKQLPPIINYDPVNDRSSEVQRPPLIHRQINPYQFHYAKMLNDGGFRKEQGVFESYAELLIRNTDLIKVKKKPTSLPVLPIRKPPIPNYPKPTPKKTQFQTNDPYTSGQRKQYLNHDNRYLNAVQHFIDRNMIQSEINVSKERLSVKPTPKRSPQVIQLAKQYKVHAKINRRDYSSAIAVDYNEDEISDVLSKCNELDENDKEFMCEQLNDFDRRVKELKEFYIQEEILKGAPKKKHK